jgi:hypothetical protein
VQLAELCEQRLELDSSMRRRIGLESADRFAELPFHCNRARATGLVPRDRDVNEPLEEVAFLCRRGAPHLLENFVCGEILAGANQRDPARELRV